MGRMLRPEASELEWEHLFPEQQDAYLELAELLAAAAAPNAKTPERTNRIIFLDGVSGVGKTTVYLSLKRYLEHPKEESYAPKIVGESELADRKEAIEKAKGLEGRLVWLEPLELEILNRPTNALADLLVHIEAKIEVDHGAKHDSSRIGFSKSQQDTIEKLALIQNNLASLWDGNPSLRASRVAPEAFAAEVVDTARHRAKIRRELNKLIDDVAKHFFDDKLDKLLVLPIDDLHEHPKVALEILRLLRLIHSAHFIVLAIGNFGSLEFVEIQRRIQELKTLATPAEDRSTPGSAEEDLVPRATNLAFFSIRKQFAESQVVELAPPDPENEATWNHIKRGYPNAAFQNKQLRPLNELFMSTINRILKADENSSTIKDSRFYRYLNSALVADSQISSNLSGSPSLRPRLVFKQSIRNLIDFSYSLQVRKKNFEFSLQSFLLAYDRSVNEEFYGFSSRLPKDIFQLNPYSWSDLRINEAKFRVDVAWKDNDVENPEVIILDSIDSIIPRSAAWLQIILCICAIREDPGIVNASQMGTMDMVAEEDMDDVPYFTISKRPESDERGSSGSQSTGGVPNQEMTTP